MELVKIGTIFLNKRTENDLTLFGYFIQTQMLAGGNTALYNTENNHILCRCEHAFSM